MILILGGTSEGRAIAAALTGAGYKVLVSVVSGYGRELLDGGSSAEVLVKQLDADALAQLIGDKEIKLVVDATHPYAKEITVNAWTAVGRTGTPYIRYDRPAVEKTGQIHAAENYQEAARLAVKMGDAIFLTIGSKNLAPFVTESKKAGKRIIARVLPEAGVLSQCAQLGIAPGNILAVQGPFSLALNLALLREYQADVLVTKDSGTTGGTDTKLAAAAVLGIPVVMVTRPSTAGLPVTNKIEEILAIARQVNLIL